MHYDPSNSLTLGEIRDRLQKMTDEELERYGRDTKYMASPQAAYGQPRAVWGLQLEEARAEWRRRAARTYCICHGSARGRSVSLAQEP